MTQLICLTYLRSFKHLPFKPSYVLSKKPDDNSSATRNFSVGDWVRQDASKDASKDLSKDVSKEVSKSESSPGQEQLHKGGELKPGEGVRQDVPSPGNVQLNQSPESGQQMWGAPQSWPGSPSPPWQSSTPRPWPSYSPRPWPSYSPRPEPSCSPRPDSCCEPPPCPEPLPCPPCPAAPSLWPVFALGTLTGTVALWLADKYCEHLKIKARQARERIKRKEQCKHQYYMALGFLFLSFMFAVHYLFKNRHVF